MLGAWQPAQGAGQQLLAMVPHGNPTPLHETPAALEFLRSYTCDVENAFCGGTWRGTTKLLDYIQVRTTNTVQSMQPACSMHCPAKLSLGWWWAGMTIVHALQLA
jgi:hypothetical protein